MKVLIKSATKKSGKKVALISLSVALLSNCGSVSSVDDSAVLRAEGHDLSAPRPRIASPPLGTNGDEVTPFSVLLDIDNLPVPSERFEPVAYRLPNGEIHWYETVYLPQGGVNWVQAKWIAEQEGGYLASVHSDEENAFLFSLVEDLKYWYKFDHGEGLFNLSGPFLGGFQPQGSIEPDGNWRWASGEPWSYVRWQKEGLDIGINMRPDDQPNNNGPGQNVLAFGEVDVPANYWSDVPHIMGTHNTPLPQCYGFIIEYNEKPD